MKDFLKWGMYGSVFAVPFVLLIVSSSMFFPFITGKNFAFRILVEIGFASWALLALIDRDYRPRWSWITVAIGTLVAVMFLAALFGEYPLKSFWSNFERMEGWVTLVHFFLYFLVLGAALRTEKVWNYFLNTALVAAVIMSLFALGQIAGLVDVSQGASWRIDGRLGNSSYLGVYMLFHMFIAAWMFIRAKSPEARYIYGALFFVFGFVLLRTGTRGSTLGLIGGSVLAFSYLALMAPKKATIKKWAAGGVVAVVIIAGGLWLLRDTSFVKDSPMLNRVANITLAEGNIRFTIWQMALEGVKERPVLGWGQENFSYVFSKYYDPSLYGAEPWYDRTHNIFLDWLIAGGVLGLLAYLGILATALWYAVLRPFISNFRGQIDNHFSVPEQALVLGLLAAYMFHNLFVFDNLASWIFYAVVLALIHFKVSAKWPALERFSIDQGTWERLAVPFGVLLTLGAVYFINVPGILAAKDVINTYRVPTAAESLEVFKQALDRDSFARQEIVEQLAQSGIARIASAETSTEDKAKLRQFVSQELKSLMEEKPGDARLHIIAGSFYRSIGDLEEAEDQLDTALSLSPQKQAILEDQGLVLLAKGDKEGAIERYRASYELDSSNNYARVRLAAALAYAEHYEDAAQLASINDLEKDSPLWYAFVTDEISFRLYYQAKNFEVMEYILNGRKDLYPDDTSVRTNLAAFYYEHDRKAEAIAVLKEAIVDIPSFKVEGERLIDSLEAED